MNDSATHTPGPWNVDVWEYPTATPPRTELVVESTTNRLAVLDCDINGDNEFIVPRDVAKANAQLIAAAPDMLGALKSALRALEDNLEPGPMDEDAKAGIRAAIAKATATP